MINFRRFSAPTVKLWLRVLPYGGLFQSQKATAAMTNIGRHFSNDVSKGSHADDDDEESSKITIFRPQESECPSFKQRHEKTALFIALVSDMRRTTKDECADMLTAAVKLGTLQPKHVHRILAQLSSSSPVLASVSTCRRPLTRHMVRAITCVHAIAKAFDDIESTSDTHVGEKQGYQISKQCRNLSTAIVWAKLVQFLLCSKSRTLDEIPRPDDSVPDSCAEIELYETVGRVHYHEPLWWALAQLQLAVAFQMTPEADSLRSVSVGDSALEMNFHRKVTAAMRVHLLGAGCTEKDFLCLYQEAQNEHRRGLCKELLGSNPLC